ncbi:MAG: ATP-binding protein [Gammaproteobacteria bacterium]|nr:ATP-binding protein [Gammaproteobacteria bacterium]
MPNETPLEELFLPGTGTIPPHLAGRGREQDYFNRCLRTLVEGRPIAQDMIVYGPRGNGKTALLRSLQKNISGGDDDILSAWTTPDKIKTPRMLFERIAAAGQKGRKWFKQFSANIQVAGHGGGLSIDRGSEWGLIDTSIAFGELCKQTPFVLIIDEAHMLEPDVAQDLLNTSQDVRGEGKAFFLVLAGTPGLRNRMSLAGASFWSRSRKFAVGRLSPKESIEALVKPLQDFGITFAPDVVEDVVRRAQRYPFFIQLWGQALCMQIQRGEIIDAAHVQAAQGMAGEERDMMYVDRYNELRNAGYLGIARHLTHLFREKGPTIQEKILREKVEKYCAKEGKDGLETLLGLEDLGYVWQTHSNPIAYEAGIPSLMSYVAAQLQKQNVGIKM